MDCSIIITACNERPHILYTIQSIIEELEGYCRYEIIIVDNRSTDGLDEFFRRNLTKGLKYIKYDDTKSHWVAKNKGVELATGRNLFFIDAHCIIGRDSLRKQIEFLDNFKGKIGGVHCYHHPMIMKFRTFEHYPKRKFTFRFRRAQVGEEFKKPYAVAHMSTCGMMCPKSVFDELGGWSNHFGTRWGGEAHINLKHATCGYPHFIHPEAHYYHYKHSYGYTFDLKRDGYKNLMIPAYVIGGEQGLVDFVDNLCKQKKIKKRPCLYDRLAKEVRVHCKEEMEFVKSKQIMTLNEFYEKWSID